MANNKPVLLSGIQPSGRLTLGNYIGAIKHWVTLSESYTCYFPVVDLHTITVRQDPALLRERSYDFLVTNIACGLAPEKNTLFIQSHVPEHCELAWILNCHTQMGELNRMTQFKDKSQKNPSNINAGLFSYPVLQAADILVHNANLVPVGADQKQHLELTRDIAIRFNNLYGDTFTIPEPYIPKSGGRIMSLQDPEKKMSKSDDVEGNYIAILDPPEKIRKKFKRCVTDSGSDIRVADDKPGISNLLHILSAVTDKSIEELEKEFSGSGYGDFKMAVADAVINVLTPIQERYQAIRADDVYLNKVLHAGAETAQVGAATVLQQVKEVLGFIPS